MQSLTLGGLSNVAEEYIPAKGEGWRRIRVDEWRRSVSSSREKKKLREELISGRGDEKGRASKKKQEEF